MKGGYRIPARMSRFGSGDREFFLELRQPPISFGVYFLEIVPS
jgi:hypothetical protein